MGLFTVLLYFLSVMPIALLNRFFYAFDRRRCRKINAYLSTACSRRAFTLSNAYIGFKFCGARDALDSLPSQYLVVSNHQSLLDIPLFMHYLGGERVRFVAKAELGRGIPLISVMLRSGGHCLVRRTGGASQAMRALDSFADGVRKNDWIPVIFPEGTRSRDGTLGTFYAAGFRRIIERAPMPVVVCALDGGWRISSLFGLAKNLRGGSYRVKVLKLFPAPKSKEEAIRVLEEGKGLIEAQLALWRGSAKR